jgi:hypothetical protein
MAAAEASWLGALLLLVLAAVLVFWRIQLYLADPRRRELNEEWFARFEEFIRQKYRDPELKRRVHALDGHFQNRQ